MKLVTVIGARPQFIKAATVSSVIASNASIEEITIHTGQHFDANMSSVFFEQLGLAEPSYQLDIHGGNHGEMTARMLVEIETVLLENMPDALLVYGDTNSTLAGALAAAKLNVPVVHVEAGLRSYNRSMPEEINRVLTDHVSTVLFCPSKLASENLAKEGVVETGSVVVTVVGDVMHDAVRQFSNLARRPASLEYANGFTVATLHRAENTNNIDRLTQLVEALNRLHSEGVKIVLPLHPRTRHILAQEGIQLIFTAIEPVGYLEMQWLLANCSLVLTDSGGLQKEAYFHQKPCVTLRDETEWTELVEIGVNRLVGASVSEIMTAVKEMPVQASFDDMAIYGDGNSAGRIVKTLLERL